MVQAAGAREHVPLGIPAAVELHVGARRDREHAVRAQAASCALTDAPPSAAATTAIATQAGTIRVTASPAGSPAPRRLGCSRRGSVRSARRWRHRTAPATRPGCARRSLPRPEHVRGDARLLRADDRAHSRRLEHRGEELLHLRAVLRAIDRVVHQEADQRPRRRRPVMEQIDGASPAPASRDRPSASPDRGPTESRRCGRGAAGCCRRSSCGADTPP